MARKHPASKTKHQPQPEPAQLRALERLIDEGETAAAIARARSLLKRFPDHSGLHRILVEALVDSGNQQAAGLAAFAWAERRPNSLPAQEALLQLALRLGHSMLAERTAHRVLELGGEAPGFPLPPDVREQMLLQPDGNSASAEDMERFDLGKLHLEGDDFAGTIDRLEGLDLIPARNNRALALFHLGRTTEARDAYLANWDADPDNLFALGWAARLRLYLGDETGAKGLITPLGAARARRTEDALGQLEALLLLRADQQALDAFEYIRASEWISDAGGLQAGLLHHYGACAASRLGHGERAAALWRESLAHEPRMDLAEENLEHLRDASKPPAFPAVLPIQQALRIPWIKAARGSSYYSRVPDLDADLSEAYLEAVFLCADRTLRELLGIVIRQRIATSDPGAADLARRLARTPVGTRSERFALLRTLSSHGLVAPKEPMDVWDGDGVTQVVLLASEITREPNESDLPEDLQVLLGESLQLMGEDQVDAAEERLQAILVRLPDHPVALGNLAGIRAMQGRAQEGRELLQRVVDRHPDYLFARCNLAQTLIEDGELDEAQRLLEGLMERERLHIQEYFVLTGSQAMLAAARGDLDAAHSMLSSLETLVEDDDDRRRFAIVVRGVVRVAAGDKRDIVSLMRGPALGFLRRFPTHRP